MLAVMWVYFDVTIDGIGTDQDFDDIYDTINQNELERDLQISGIKDTFSGPITRIDGTLLQMKQQIEELQSRPVTDVNEDVPPEVLSVASDLEFESYADITRTFQTSTFHQGDQVTLSAYNDNLNNKVFFYITDPNGVTTEPEERGSNQGSFQWIYQIPEFALTGQYTLTLEIGDKVDAIKISVVES